MGGKPGMPNIIDFLKIALTSAHSCHILKSAPDTKEMKINEYYLFQLNDRWELRFKKSRQIRRIRESRFNQIKGLENLAAALAKLDSKAKNNTAAVDEVMQIISTYHLHDKKAIANKIKTSLAYHDHGFISRIFSDLNNPFLTRSESGRLTHDYYDLLKSLIKEYKDLLKTFKISDDEFPTFDLSQAKAKDFNNTVAKFELWLKEIVNEGKRELFDTNGAIKSEIIYLLINSMRVTPAEMNELIADFKEDSAKQSMMSGYISLIFQAILKLMPPAFMDEMPDMIKSLTSRLITSNSQLDVKTVSVERAILFSSEEKSLAELEEINVHALTVQYQTAAAKLNEAIVEFTNDILSNMKNQEHSKIIFNAIRNVNSSGNTSSTANPLAGLINILKNENYNDDDKAFEAAMLLASIFIGKENAFTKKKNIWETLGATDDFSRRKCGLEAIEFFKTLALPIVEPGINPSSISLALPRK
jgi:hypothetical protein